MNYTWRIARLGLDDVLNKDSVLLENAIVNVQWKKIAEDTDGITASYVGTTALDVTTHSAADFIALNDVTSEQVISWVQENISSVEMSRIDKQLERKIERNRLRKISPNWK